MSYQRYPEYSDDDERSSSDASAHRDQRSVYPGNDGTVEAENSSSKSGEWVEGPAWRMKKPGAAKREKVR